ncbi:zinc-dependent alcohol dehydrogenase [Candidatus Entotheonella palauensis]|uniref:zinc-dependent alcohol dehydrogenase n=1 Tax=Candidatus Entotheonella palauensis TaxID=93172 RepID=UPI000B7F3D36|nr:alcohol dehydrogenase catalytic domain-containing protein [Candidatus Entotheonella palauensis]
MKAAVFKAPGAPLAVETVADPQPGPQELLISVGACGVCGTDLHWTENRDTSGGWRELRAGGILGHEFAGEVVEVGQDVKDRFRPGDSVCALPFIGCGRCAACMAGRVYRCAEVDTRASTTLPGAYAEYARVGSAETVRLPAGVDHRTGALVEPLAVGLAAAERARFSSGASVLIMGAGPVGLSVAMWCRFLGARHVVVSDLVPSRAERSADFGATDSIDASREVVAERMQQIAGGPPDVVFECVGVPGTLQLAVEHVANDGCVVVAGLCMGADSFSPAIAVVKAIDLRFTMCYEKRHFEIIVDHLDRGRIDVSQLVTDTVGFGAFPAKFEQLKRAGDDLKVLLNPSLA